jgi:hypothetical protein
MAGTYGTAMHNGVMTRYFAPEGAGWDDSKYEWNPAEEVSPPAPAVDFSVPPKLDFPEEEPDPFQRPPSAPKRQLGDVDFVTGQDPYVTRGGPGTPAHDPWADWGDESQQDEEAPKKPQQPQRVFIQGGQGQGPSSSEYTPPSLNYSFDPVPSGAGYGGAAQNQFIWGASYGGMGTDPYLKSKSFFDPFKQHFNQLPLHYF